MPSALRIKLTVEENKQLIELCFCPKVPTRTKKRAEALRLLNQGLKVKAISEDLNCAPQTIREAAYRWLTRGVEGLFDEKRVGRPKKWSTNDVEFLENVLDKEERTYNSKQLAEKLSRERQVHLSCYQVQRILKKNK